MNIIIYLALILGIIVGAQIFVYIVCHNQELGVIITGLLGGISLLTCIVFSDIMAYCLLCDFIRSGT